MIVEDHDMSDRLFAFGDGSRRDHEDSLLSQRCGIRQPVVSNHHHSFLKRSKIDISQNVNFFRLAVAVLQSYLDANGGLFCTSGFVEHSRGEDKAAERSHGLRGGVFLRPRARDCPLRRLRQNIPLSLDA
jgi:hypothetical protein